MYLPPVDDGLRVAAEGFVGDEGAHAALKHADELGDCGVELRAELVAARAELDGVRRLVGVGGRVGVGFGVGFGVRVRGRVGVRVGVRVRVGVLVGVGVRVGVRP